MLISKLVFNLKSKQIIQKHFIYKYTLFIFTLWMLLLLQEEVKVLEKQ